MGHLGRLKVKDRKPEDDHKGPTLGELEARFGRATWTPPGEKPLVFPPYNARPRSLYGRPPLPDRIAEEAVPIWLRPIRAVVSGGIVAGLSLAFIGIGIGLQVIEAVDSVVSWVRS